jgi:hypothetical protein
MLPLLAAIQTARNKLCNLYANEKADFMKAFSFLEAFR